MNTYDFQHRILPLADKIFPMIARILGDDYAAEDAVQEIMMKLWDRKKQLGRHENIVGFVVLTARNYCLDELKKKRPDMDDSSKLLNIDNARYSGDMLEWKELKEIVEIVLRQLPENQQEVMIMRDLEGFEINEIAIAMQLREDHVRVLLSRARKKVGEELTKIYSYEKK